MASLMSCHGAAQTSTHCFQSCGPIVLNSARVVEGEVRALGWTVGSRAVMEVLGAEAPLTVPHVAARLSLARQNVQRQVDQLTRLGHLHATPKPAHRRSGGLRVVADGTLSGSVVYESFVHQPRDWTRGGSTRFQAQPHQVQLGVRG